MLEKVEAWRLDDGRLFENKEEAEAIEKAVDEFVEMIPYEVSHCPYSIGFWIQANWEKVREIF